MWAKPTKSSNTFTVQKYKKYFKKTSFSIKKFYLNDNYFFGYLF